MPRDSARFFGIAPERTGRYRYRVPLLPLRRLALAALLLSVAAAAQATTYEVGPGKPLANVGDVPWESLAAGDTVLIYARPTPYREKWVISRAGTAAQPITVRGVADASGNLPVISGDGAATRLQLDYTNESRGIIK